ncbi:MAG: hypothetical protein KI790_10410 [Cyclobacteriaceae bacterium]|nr:hypothetical protein [Cyclobacteriaceae bacterium HetDA_MAG_MS6]
MHKNVGFVMISTGPFARTCKAEVCLESMYRISGYTGKAFLITDSPECFDLPAIRKNAGSDNIQIISVEKFSNRLDWPLTLQWKNGFPRIRTLTPTKRYKSKALKARIFDLIPDKDIEILIYIDADVIFQKKTGIENLLQFAAEDWSSDGLKIRVRSWDNEEKKFNANCAIHGGFFIVHRQYSSKALAHWGRIMSVKNYWIENVTDKEKFLRAYQESIDAGEDYLSVTPIPNGFEVILDPTKTEALIGHITNGRIKKHGKKAIENFLNKFELRSYPQGYYTLPGMPRWLDDIIFLGYPPYFGQYKIEYVWKRFRSFFGYA